MVFEADVSVSAGRPAEGVRQQGADQFFGQPLVDEWSGSGRSDIATRNGAGFAGAMEGHGRKNKANIVKNFSVWYTFCRNMKN